MENKPKKKRGLGSMSREKVEAIASLGGKAVSSIPGHMAEIGRRGGKKSIALRRMNKNQK